MPIISDFEYQCHDVFLHDDTLEHTRKKDNCSLVNEIIIINNTQGLNECNKNVVTKEQDNETLLSTPNSERKNNGHEVKKVSQHRMLKRIFGLIASVTGIISLWRIAGGAYHNNNQRCLSIDKGFDLLNDSPISNVESAIDILPFKLYKNDGSFYNILCDDMVLTQHEYLKEILVIDNLSLQNINQLYQAVLSIDHKRKARSIPLPYEHHVNASEIISNIINNNAIDWRVREEFKGIYDKAKDFLEIKSLREGVEKDVKLILACVSLMLQYLHENKINNLSKVSFIYGIAFLESLLSILDEMKAADLGIIDKRFKQSVLLMIRDIYSNKEIESYDNSLYFHEFGTNGNSPEEKKIYFYSAVRSSVLVTSNKKTVTPESEIDDVKIVHLTSCQKQRDDLTLSEVLRTISETIKSPLLSLIKETRIVYQYGIEDNGCPAPISPEMQGVIESVTVSLDNLMSWIPHYNRGRLVSLIAASVISMIADAIENKELSLDSVSEINGYILNLTKDIVSSLSTKQIKDMDSANAGEEINTMVKDLKYQKNKLTIHIDNPKKTVFIDEGYNNFVDIETQKALYYDSRNYWYISRDESYTFKRQSALAKDHGYKLTEPDVVVIMNSSPELYADGTFIKRNNIMKVLVEGQLYDVSEIHIKDNIYRYVASRDDVYTPLINIGGAWFFEHKNAPHVGYRLIDFIRGDEKIKSNLISKNIIHSDVSPIRFSKKYQFDKNDAHYLKINDGYYLLKKGVYLSHYIEGEGDILPVELVSDKYQFGYDVFGEMYNAYKKEISVFDHVNENEISYLDSSVIKRLINNNLLAEDAVLINEDELRNQHVVKASQIYGATSIGGNDFIIFENNFIKIISNHDDTFLLGDKNAVRAYKNSKSNVYYYMPDDNNDDYRSQTFKIRRAHCITKRQLFSLCSASYYESKDITSLLRQNAKHGIDFDDLSEHLEPYEDANGFYRDKRSSEGLYYLSQEGGVFHVREEKNNDDMIPVFFKIYGKNEDNSINNNLLVTEVSIVKDFDTKKSIVTTPLEAMNMEFNLDAEKNRASLRWSKSQVSRKPINADFEFLDNIQKQVNANNNLELIELLFSLNGKKVVTSIKNSDNYIEMHKDSYLNNPSDYFFKSMAALEANSQYPYILDVFNDAFNRAKGTIGMVHTYIKEGNTSVDNYILSKLGISSYGARKLFINTLLSKLKRMETVFDTNDKSNIILVMNKKGKSISSVDKHSSEKDSIVGFSYIHDPLDRIYIKTDTLTLDSRSTMPTWAKSRELQKKIKSLSNIMCHEAIHALGTPEDYFYHNSIDEGEFDTIENTLIRTEIALRRGRGVNDAFINMCTLYFMSNPVYQNFELNSLLKPETLSLLFQYDSYLRALILINNPDTITVVINDLAVSG